MWSIRKNARWIVDFLMCWIALCGLANVAVGIASFHFKINLSIFGEPIEAPVQRFSWIALYLAVSIVGFTYMLWRNRWRFQLLTLLKVPILWCVIFASVAMIPQLPVIGVVAFLTCTLFIFSYAIYWASRAARMSE
jgi:hypothetical protein